MAKNRKLKETNKNPPNILPFFCLASTWFNFIEEKSLPHTQPCVKGLHIQTNKDLSILIQIQIELLLLKYNHTCSFAQMYLLIGAVSQGGDVANGPLVLVFFFCS